MKSIKYLLLLLPIISLSILACNDEPDPTIDPTLLPYIEAFVFEGNDRGYTNPDGSALDVETIGIEVQFENIADPAVIGRCQRDENGNSLSIAVDPQYWKLSTELEKEYIMFHELGHCVLSRDHTTAADGNNTCLSIMEPGTGQLCTSNYTSSTRSMLLDELFDF